MLWCALHNPTPTSVRVRVRVSATNLAKETVSQSCLAKVLQQCFLLDTVKAMSKNNISHLKTPNHIHLCLYVYINSINVITIHVYKIRYPPRSSSVALFSGRLGCWLLAEMSVRKSKVALDQSTYFCGLQMISLLSFHAAYYHVTHSTSSNPMSVEFSKCGPLIERNDAMTSGPRWTGRTTTSPLSTISE